MKKIIRAVTNEIKTVLFNINVEEATELALEIMQAKRIFVQGEGRSGLIGKAFAMRLMHAGFPVYVIGETITPDIKANNLFIAISGSGSTSSTLQLAAKAKEIGACLFAITTERESKLACMSDSIIKVPAATKYRRPNEPKTVQPLGNQFDQAVHLLLDAVVIFAVQTTKQHVGYREMAHRHTNLE